MAAKQIDLKPYKKALEALISHQTRAKMSALIGNAAANVDDPVLRNALIELLDKIYIYNDMPAKPERLISMLNSVRNADEIVSALIIYLTKVIDGQESAWETIALKNGWKKPRS